MPGYLCRRGGWRWLTYASVPARRSPESYGAVREDVNDGGHGRGVGAASAVTVSEVHGMSDALLRRYRRQSVRELMLCLLNNNVRYLLFPFASALCRFSLTLNLTILVMRP
jgi:hypothetical protein